MTTKNLGVLDNTITNFNRFANDIISIPSIMTTHDSRNVGENGFTNFVGSSIPEISGSMIDSIVNDVVPNDESRRFKGSRLGESNDLLFLKL